MIEVPRDEHKSLRMLCLKFGHSPVGDVTSSFCVSAWGTYTTITTAWLNYLAK